jgi:hypothetical protein
MSAIEVVAIRAIPVLITLVVLLVAHYGKRQVKTEAKLEALFSEMVQHQRQQCITARKAYKLVRQEQAYLRAKLQEE